MKVLMKYVSKESNYAFEVILFFVIILCEVYVKYIEIYRLLVVSGIGHF